MKECRLCKRPLNQEDATCSNCGYDPKTDTINPSFKREAKSGLGYKKNTAERRGIHPGVRKFAVIGLLIVLFSIFYRHNFSINGIIYEAKLIFDKIKGSKSIAANMFTVKKGNEMRELKLTDVSSYDSSEKSGRYNNLVIKGIYFDPSGKSLTNINGKFVAEGESYEGVQVKKINRDYIEVLVNGEIKVLSVSQSLESPINK